MSDSKPRPLSESEWTNLIEAYHASGLTQKAFSQQHGIGYDRFRHHYQRSPLFRGKRRQPAVPDFKAVSLSSVNAVNSMNENTEGWSVHVGHSVRIDCPQTASIEAIICLARGLSDDA